LRNNHQNNNRKNLRNKVVKIFKKLKIEIFTNGIAKEFIQLNTCLEKNENAFEGMIKELALKAVDEGEMDGEMSASFLNF